MPEADVRRSEGNRALVRSPGHPQLRTRANGPWCHWGWTRTPAQTWVAAWRHVVRVFRAAGATNVTWMLTLNVAFPNSGPVSAHWPGASYVDWVGIDGYYVRRGHLPPRLAAGGQPGGTGRVPAGSQRFRASPARMKGDHVTARRGREKRDLGTSAGMPAPRPMHPTRCSPGCQSTPAASANSPACAGPRTRLGMPSPRAGREPIAPLPLKRERSADPARGLLGTEPKPLPSLDQGGLWTAPWRT